MSYCGPYCKCRDCKEIVSMEGLWDLIKDRYKGIGSPVPECLSCGDTGIMQVDGGSNQPCSCKE